LIQKEPENQAKLIAATTQARLPAAHLGRPLRSFYLFSNLSLRTIAWQSPWIGSERNLSHSSPSIAASLIAFISPTEINLRDDRTINIPNKPNMPHTKPVRQPITLFEPW
jgi:hypothetical protein